MARVYLNPGLLRGEAIGKPIGPFHPVAAWRSSPLDESNGLAVIAAYDLVWRWSASAVLAKLYFEEIEAKETLNYWTASVLYERSGRLLEDEIEALLLEHQKGRGR